MGRNTNGDAVDKALGAAVKGNGFFIEQPEGIGGLAAAFRSNNPSHDDTRDTGC
jgi:hypothetical protein